jgi:hypothetical protein
MDPPDYADRGGCWPAHRNGPRGIARAWLMREKTVLVLPLDIEMSIE